MAFRQEEFTFTTSGATTSQVLTFDAAVAANSLLIAVLQHVDGPSTKAISSVTDSLGNSWTAGLNVTNTAGANDCSISVWYCLASAAGACSVTITANTGTGTTWWDILEFDPVLSFDASGTNSLSLDTTSGAQPFPFATSGSQSNPGVMLALSTNNPQASAFSTPTGFTALGLITSANRLYYRYSVVAESFASISSNMRSSSAGNLDTAQAVLSFLTGATSGGEVTDDMVICCSEGQNETVANQGGTQGQGAVPFQTPIIGTALGCVGGGLVPTQADLTWSETWWSY